MAVKSPVYIDANGNIREVSSTDPDGIGPVRTVRVRVKNNSGSLISAGALVKTAGSDGALIQVTPLVAGDLEFFGVVEANIANTAEGEVIVMGFVPYDTSPYTAGDKLYYNAAGSIVTTAPTETHIYLGVTVDDAASGFFYIPREAGVVEIAPPEIMYFNIGAARSGNVSDVYMYAYDNLQTNLSGYILPYDCTLYAISAGTQFNETWSAEVHDGTGTLVPGALLSISADTSGFTNSLSIDFNAGDEVQFYLNGSSVRRANMQAFFKSR